MITQIFKTDYTDYRRKPYLCNHTLIYLTEHYKYFFALSLLFFFTGCAAIKPKVSLEDAQALLEEQKARELASQIDSLQRVNNIGYKLMFSIPEKDKKGSFIFSGLLLIEADEYIKRVYGLSTDKGVVVVGLVRASPAEDAGIKPGDIIKSIDGIGVNNLQDVAYVLSHKAVHQKVEISVLRLGNTGNFEFRLATKPLAASFRMVDNKEINSGAIPNLIVVTGGLMRFVENDDELAVILGHELAHITKGHHKNETGFNLLSIISGIAGGIGINNSSTDSADVLTQAVSSALSAAYPRDLEQEADYAGLGYADLAGYDINSGVKVWERLAVSADKSLTSGFLNTHHLAHQRIVRIKRIARELVSRREYIQPDGKNVSPPKN